MRKLKMFSIPDNSQMTTHTLPEGGTLRKVTQIGGKWIDNDRNDFLPIEKVKVTQIGGPNESIMTELIFTN